MARPRKLWFATDCRVHTNPKVSDLAAALKLDIDTTVGKLCRLWAWAKVSEIEDGRLGRLPASELAGIMRWQKKPDTLLDAMVACRFLDADADGSLTIHDWYDLNGKAAEQARIDRDRKR